MDDFLRDGFGFCVFHDGQAASACYTYSACVSSGDVEIAVGTVESFRGRGLAKAVCGAAIQHCLDSRLSPQWSCLVDNVASIRLAQSLGYELGEEYTVFFPNLGN
jgi:RimJ/RimL family protein N-acetyltransferase